MNVLFVCTGNICRSLMAERLLQKYAADGGLSVDVRSCGVMAERYYSPPDQIWRELAALGADCSPHTPQLVTRELLAWADIVFCMTRAHRAMTLERYPEFTGKVFVFRTWAGLAGDDIEDPMGQADAVYARSRAAIQETLAAALAKAPFTK